jgi:hypothetical protein
MSIFIAIRISSTFPVRASYTFPWSELNLYYIWFYIILEVSILTLFTYEQSFF